MKTWRLNRRKMRGWVVCLERAKGIEPSYAAWEAAVLPLNYARKSTFPAFGEFFRHPLRPRDQTKDSGDAVCGATDNHSAARRPEHHRDTSASGFIPIELKYHKIDSGIFPLPIWQVRW
jgi:hypothetical protein